MRTSFTPIWFHSAILMFLSGRANAFVTTSSTITTRTNELNATPKKHEVFVASAATAAAIFFASAPPAGAVDIGKKGEKLFEANCAECHTAGKKLGVEAMSLQKEAMEKGVGLDVSVIEGYLKEEFPHKYMPFGMKAQEYSQVSSYILDNAVNDKWGD